MSADPKQVHKIKNTVDRVKRKMRITKVVATRAVKTKRGDFFAGMSAAWDTVQDDASGAGADMDLLTTTDEHTASGMTLQDAQVAHIILSMEASIAAWRAALSEGAITVNHFEGKVRDVKRNALAHLCRILPADDAHLKVEAA
jgi:hypothetical protein